MHTYRKSKDEELWTVGYFEPFCGTNDVLYMRWTPLKDFPDEGKAAIYVNYLNGCPGNKTTYVEILQP